MVHKENDKKMAIDQKLIGKRIFERYKRRMLTTRRPKNKTQRIAQNIRNLRGITGDIKSITKKKKKYKKLPKKITKKVGMFNQRATSIYKQPLKTRDLLKTLPIGGGRNMAIAKYTPRPPSPIEMLIGPITGSPIAGVVEAPEDPEENELLITPNIWGPDEFDYGSGLDLSDYDKKKFETDLETTGIPETIGGALPQLPDFSNMFGDLGKYGLIIAAGLIAVMLIGGRK